MLGLEPYLYDIMGHKLIISVHEKQMRSGSLYRVSSTGVQKRAPNPDGILVKTC